MCDCIKKRILLINSPRELAVSNDEIPKDKRMPLGLMYISSFLKNKGFEVKIIDTEALSLKLSDIIKIVLEYNPEVVGLNCHSSNRFVVYEIVRTIKAVSHRRLCVLGGTHPTLMPKATLEECSSVDVVVLGEGEKTFLLLCQKTDQYYSVPGIAYRNGNNIIINNPMPRIENLDTLPFPDYTDIPFSIYTQYEDKSLPGLWKRGYLYATRGCKFNCTYCYSSYFWNRIITCRTAESVIQEIKHNKEIYDVKRYFFYDDNLLDWSYLKEFCSKCHETNIQWSCSARIEQLDHVTIKMMSEGGCKEIASGLESGSKHVLNRINKNWLAVLTPDEVGEKIALCLDYGIVLRTHFMLGFPWETQHDINQTVNLAVYLRDKYSLKDANFFIVRPFPGTLLSDEFAKSGDISELERNHYSKSWLINDWLWESNKKVAAKLMRFNDLPEISINPHLDTLSIRQLIRNAYLIFFNESINSTSEFLWKGIIWK